MPAWIMNNWQGNPVIYFGDNRNSATFYGPNAGDFQTGTLLAVRSLDQILKALPAGTLPEELEGQARHALKLLGVE